MRVAVLGHRGMLGRRVMEAFPDAITFGQRYTGEPDDPLLAAIEAERPDWVINCIVERTDEAKMLDVNAGLPHRLKRWRLIQPSTDHLHDDTEYAKSKRKGEVGRVIRCAIVDPEGGLLARAHHHDTVGEVNREWNGITTKAWVGLAQDIMAGKLPSLVIPGTPTISHYQLLATARRVFGWDTTISRDSRRYWKAPRPNLMLPPIEEQLRQYR